ncbi:hypothetical protein ACE1SV_76000 [Streptomyces sennicomposti]
MEDWPDFRRCRGRGGGKPEAGTQPGHGAREDPFRALQHIPARGEVALRPLVIGAPGVGQRELPRW